MLAAFIITLRKFRASNCAWKILMPLTFTCYYAYQMQIYIQVICFSEHTLPSILRDRGYTHRGQQGRNSGMIEGVLMTDKASNTQYHSVVGLYGGDIPKHGF